MKILLGVLLGLAAALALWFAIDTPPTGRGTDAPASTAATDARLAEIERQFAALQLEWRQRSADLAHTPRTEIAPAVPLIAPSNDQRPDAGVDLGWYLQQYVRSFEDGGEGSEYFRLAVDAYATRLLDPICNLVRNGSAVAGLRTALAAILGKPRFAHSQPAIDALLVLLRDATTDALGRPALAGLAVIGDAGICPMLEHLFPGLATLDLKQRTLAVLVQFGGTEANRILDRLFVAAATSEERALVPLVLSTADADGALAVLRKASTDALPVRLPAAKAMERFRGEAFAQFVGEWLAYESDPQVRRALEQARARAREVPSYAAQKATGAPDAEPSQDHPNAWASKQPDMGLQWLEVGYRPARRASAVRIHEVNVAGAVVQVLVVDESGQRHEVWAGVDPTAVPGVFQVSFVTTGWKVKAVRIVLDTDKRPGWSEIDAVELLGPDGNAWAVEATASSSYGQ